MEQLKEDFATGKHKLCICNSVWKKGVNFPKLQYLIRADGGASSIDSTQIAGRLTRLSDGKEKSYLIDFRDEFNDSAAQKSFGRKGHYRTIGFIQTGWQ